MVHLILPLVADSLQLAFDRGKGAIHPPGQFLVGISFQLSQGNLLERGVLKTVEKLLALRVHHRRQVGSELIVRKVGESMCRSGVVKRPKYRFAQHTAAASFLGELPFQLRAGFAQCDGQQEFPGGLTVFEFGESPGCRARQKLLKARGLHPLHQRSGDDGYPTVAGRYGAAPPGTVAKESRRPIRHPPRIAEAKGL